jgi:hypothetical protein
MRTSLQTPFSMPSPQNGLTPLSGKVQMPQSVPDRRGWCYSPGDVLDCHVKPTLEWLRFRSTRAVQGEDSQEEA